MDLPENAELHYYSSDRKNLAQPIISNLNRLYNERGRVGLPALNHNGTLSSIIIEYKEPVCCYKSERQFRINKLIFGRFLNKKTSFRSVDDVGNSSLLTIAGTGFGFEKGKVLFKDTEAGTYFEAPDDHIRKWQNNTIQVWIPSIGNSGNLEKRQRKYAQLAARRFSYRYVLYDC